MVNIEIKGTGKYLPKNKVTSKELAKKFNVTEEFITKRTGIQNRYFSKDETIVQMAIKAVQNALENSKIEKSEIDFIIVATTTTNELMPGISYRLQKFFDLDNCMCLDILAGCSGFINAFDIAVNYIKIGKIKNAIVVGVDILSKFTNKDDIGTAIILSDGAGATIIGPAEDEKIYESNIESMGQYGDILTCKSDEEIYMDGKEIYKYAVKETVKNIEKLLQNSNRTLEDIKYIVPHQSNLKIMKAIANRLDIDLGKMFINIQEKGNTFCASIPIAVDDMIKQESLKHGDKILLVGYGGGLNTGSILLEI